jgi:hypothetical protein
VQKVMRWFPVVASACIFMIGCGGSSHNSGTVTPPASNVPVVVTMQDQPPVGLTTLSFGIQVTGISLQGSGTPVSLLSTPVTVNLENLQTLNSLLANTTAPAGTYSSITVTFAAPQVTVINNTGATLMDGGTDAGCAASATAACQLNPALAVSSLTISSAPFPLTLTAGTPIQIALDFDSADSLVNTAQVLSINPTVTATTNITPNATTSDIVDFSGGTGQVTSASNNQVVVTDSSTGESLTLAAPMSTVFTGFNTSATCTTANTFACVQTGQSVNFNFGVSGAAGSGPTLQSLNLNSGITDGLTGTVVSTVPFEIVVTSEMAAFSGGTSGLLVGQVVQITPAAGAVFSAQTNGATLPAGLTFASIADIGVGQSVLVDSTGFVAGAGVTPGVLTTDAVTLVPSQFGGTINTLDAGTQSFDMNGLSGLFTGNNITDVTVDTSTTGTTFTGDTTGDFTGLVAGNTVDTGGLLFNSATVGGAPVLVGNQVGVTEAITPANLPRRK